jgi:uncharacterized membrane protein (DUF2068 family)
MTQPHHYNPDPHAHPGLHIIALVEAVKGALALLAASGLELLGPAPLQRWIHELIVRFQLDPNHGAIAWLVGAINPGGVHLAALVATLYGAMHLLEGWGLWRAKAWASWLGCITVALYLPFDVYALAKHPGWLSLVVVAINLLVLWVLARDLVIRRR